MSKDRFANVRGGVSTPAATPATPAAPTPQEAPVMTTPAPARPTVPKAQKAIIPDAPPVMSRAPQRETFSVRVQRELSDDFNSVVKRYKKQGWAVSNTAVVEHFFELMQDPAYAQDFMMELAEKRALEKAKDGE